MTQDFMSSLTQIAKTTNNNSNSLNISNIHMQVHQISNDSSGITYATGINIVTGEKVKARLSTIDESAADLISMGKESSLVNAKHTITRLYSGQKPREDLMAKRNKRQASFLFLDRCFLLGNDSDQIPTYRSHWANTISKQPSIETTTGYVNIQYKDERTMPDGSPRPEGKIRAWANVIEYCRFLNLNENTKNLEMLSYALRPLLSSKSPIMREGRVMAEIVDVEGKAIATFSIPQKYIQMNGTDSQGHSSAYMGPTESQDSIASYLTNSDKTANSFTISKDIARIVLNVFCDIPYRLEDFISQEIEYIDNLKTLKARLLNNELKVKVFGCRIYRFGRETLQGLVSTSRYNPLKIFTREKIDANNMPVGQLEDLFVPMILAMQVAETGRRFIVFHNRLNYNTLGEGKPKSLNELNIDLDTTHPLKTKCFTN